MKLIIKIALGIILALVLLTAGCGALVAASADEVEKELAVHQPSMIDEPEAEADSEYPGETKGQESARRSAESYLDMSGFSRSGVIKQLKFEGYSEADATYAVDALSPDWSAEAAKSAENYLDIAASRAPASSSSFASRGTPLSRRRTAPVRPDCDPPSHHPRHRRNGGDPRRR